MPRRPSLEREERLIDQLVDNAIVMVLAYLGKVRDDTVHLSDVLTGLKRWLGVPVPVPKLKQRLEAMTRPNKNGHILLDLAQDRNGNCYYKVTVPGAHFVNQARSRLCLVRTLDESAGR